METAFVGSAFGIWVRVRVYFLDKLNFRCRRSHPERDTKPTRTRACSCCVTAAAAVPALLGACPLLVTTKQCPPLLLCCCGPLTLIAFLSRRRVLSSPTLPFARHSRCWSLATSCVHVIPACMYPGTASEKNDTDQRSDTHVCMHPKSKAAANAARLPPACVVYASRAARRDRANKPGCTRHRTARFGEQEKTRRQEQKSSLRATNNFSRALPGRRVETCDRGVVLSYNHKTLRSLFFRGKNGRTKQVRTARAARGDTAKAAESANGGRTTPSSRRHAGHAG